MTVLTSRQMLQAIDHTDQQRRVLFVDDSRLMRYAGSKFLERHCQVVLAENGREAWSRLKQDDQIDLVFTDLMMPVMDGHELIKRIRRSTNRRIRQLPILVVTGDDEASACKRALGAGASDFITKPFSPQDLEHALNADARLPGRISDESGNLPERLTDNLVAHPLQQPGEPATYCLRLRQTLSFHNRQGLELALLHVRFQGYSSTTERFGRHWAEAVMRNLQRTLLAELRQEDSIHRTGDSLFSVILMATCRDSARCLLTRLRQKLIGKSIRFSSMQLPVSVRFAVQFPNPKHDDDPEELLEEARQMVRWSAVL